MVSVGVECTPVATERKFEADEGCAISACLDAEVVCMVGGVLGRVRCTDGEDAFSVGDACPHDADPGHAEG